MSKKNNIIIVVLVAFLIVVIGVLKFSFSSGYTISIDNNTNKTIENLELKYYVGNTITTIPQIEPNKSWKYNIDTNNIQGENAIILTYKDNKGNSFEESVVGYLEKGYSGKSNVIINKIDDTGKLEIEVK
ncbi:hypothetical protein GKZ28_21115 [Clostridium chromiireducens]|uniref:Uncharacterized protein n=1 Tax=Clostridium chromiireducens TaxID=225345 RepID=A0A964RQY2_9CLOT|nr:hypothetical protein [Clostridium chromiireducens]MVX66182.1 hypothetical protein [Clostridium chromiireducens]